MSWLRRIVFMMSWKQSMENRPTGYVNYLHCVRMLMQMNYGLI